MPVTLLNTTKMCTFARLTPVTSKQAWLTVLRNTCWRAVSVLKIAYHSKFSKERLKIVSFRLIFRCVVGLAWSQVQCWLLKALMSLIMYFTCSAEKRPKSIIALRSYYPKWLESEHRLSRIKEVYMELISTWWAIKSRQHCIMVIIPTNTRREHSGLNGMWIVVDRSQLL